MFRQDDAHTYSESNNMCINIMISWRRHGITLDFIGIIMLLCVIPFLLLCISLHIF